MKNLKNLTTKGIISCVLMGLAVSIMLFAHIIVLEDEVQESLSKYMQEMEEARDEAFEVQNVDDVEELCIKMGYSKEEATAIEKAYKGFLQLADGKYSFYDVVRCHSMLSGMIAAPSFAGEDSSDSESIDEFVDIMMIAKTVCIVIITVFVLLLVLGLLYILLHILGKKNKGIPVIILLVLMVILFCGGSALMNLGSAVVKMPIVPVIALVLAIVSAILWSQEIKKVESIEK